MYPDFDEKTRLELFARGWVDRWSAYGFEAFGQAAERPGWTTWGNEVAPPPLADEDDDDAAFGMPMEELPPECGVMPPEWPLASLSAVCVDADVPPF
jgi:hypothetical protein